MRIAIINGPNLNLLGRREPSIYGTRSMEQVLVDIQRMYPEVYFEYRQSNHEGVLIDWIQELGLLAMANEPCDGIILNAGGYTHTSVAILDALKAVALPTAEVHLTDITTREEFRKFSFVSLYAQKTICGKGFEGYREGLQYLSEIL